jgi:hypothetical protein
MDCPASIASMMARMPYTEFCLVSMALLFGAKVKKNHPIGWFFSSVAYRLVLVGDVWVKQQLVGW